MKNLLFILGFLFVGFVSSCDLGKEPEILGTNTQGTAGEWVVALYDTAYIQQSAEYIVTTSNTSANLPTEMWFVDPEILGVHARVLTDQSTKTISCTEVENFSYYTEGPDPEDIVELGTTSEVYITPSKVTINGGILSGLAKPPSGVTTDSMHLTILPYYIVDIYTADSYTIEDGDTTVNWIISSSYDLPLDPPYIYIGHRRTGFLEDEPH